MSLRSCLLQVDYQIIKYYYIIINIKRPSVLHPYGTTIRNNDVDLVSTLIKFRLTGLGD
jgi:hypothetical protein